MILTYFPETTTGDNERVVQWNERTLAGNTIAKSRFVGVPDELCPVTMDDARPGLDQRVFDAIQECGVGVEIRNGISCQFKTFAGKVRIDELLDLTVGGVGPIDGSEVCENLARRFACRFVDEGLLVRVQFSDVNCLKELPRSRS